MRIVATIEARMRSSRLPGKVLNPVLGRPLLELMIERLRYVERIDEIVIATTADPSCDPIVDLAHRLQVGCFRGSEDDVLDRVLKAAQHYDADLIVETTGDCPLIDPHISGLVIEEFLQHEVDYCSNILERTFPRGMDTEVFPTAVLEEVDRLTDDPDDREHVSLYIFEHPERFRLLNVSSDLSAEDAGRRLTVDTPEDFALTKAIFEHLYPQNPRFSLGDILQFLRQRDDLAQLNTHVVHKPLRQSA